MDAIRSIKGSIKRSINIRCNTLIYNTKTTYIKHINIKLNCTINTTNRLQSIAVINILINYNDIILTEGH